jgi:hypothetical protein
LRVCFQIYIYLFLDIMVWMSNEQETRVRAVNISWLILTRNDVGDATVVVIAT